MRPRWIIMTIVAIAAVVFFYGMPSKLNEGDVAPDAILIDVNGVEHALSDFWGRDEIKLKFWSPGCSVCQMELKKMKDDEENDYNDVIFISPVHVEKFPFYLLIDPNREVFSLYGVWGVPETFVVDQEGIIQKRIVGAEQN